MYRYLMRLVQGNLMKFLPPMSLTYKTWEQHEDCELGIDCPGGLVTFYQLYTFSIAWVLTSWYNLIMCFGSCMNHWNQDTQRCPPPEVLSCLCAAHSTLLRPDLATTGCSASSPLSRFVELRSVHLFLCCQPYPFCAYYRQQWSTFVSLGCADWTSAIPYFYLKISEAWLVQTGGTTSWRSLQPLCRLQRGWHWLWPVP